MTVSRFLSPAAEARGILDHLTRLGRDLDRQPRDVRQRYLPALAELVGRVSAVLDHGLPPARGPLTEHELEGVLHYMRSHPDVDWNAAVNVVAPNVVREPTGGMDTSPLREPWLVPTTWGY